MIAVVGGGGFVGRNLVEALPPCRVIEAGGYLNFDGCDTVIHLAANADVRHGWNHPYRDLVDNTQFTNILLEAMRQQGVKRLLFASSSAVYGDAPTPTPETYSGQQTSLYGASKLACEGLIGAYAAAGHISATVLRLTSMLGPYYKHGLVADFVKQLDETGTISILGGGRVQRTRCHVSDGVEAFLSRLDADPGYEVFNVGTDETISSFDVARWVARFKGASCTFRTVEESWVGDHPILLDCSKLRATGWAPKYSIEDGIRDTVQWLLASS